MNGISACASEATRIDLFWLGPGFKVNHKFGDGTQWDIPWDDLGGPFITVPSAVATNSAQLGFPHLLDVFALGPDFAMYVKSFAQGTWSNDWLSLEGDFNSGAGVFGRPNGRLDIFAVGSDYAMYHRFREGPPGSQRWQPAWEYLGGRFSSTASVISRDPTSIDVFARGADFTLRHRANVSGVWSDDWQNLGGSLASPPVAVSWGPKRMDVFAIGTDGALWHRWWDGEFWNDWESLGGGVIQTPSVVSWAPGRLDVFALGLDATIYHFWFDNQAWSGFKPLVGGQFTSGPTAVSPTPNWINLVGPGSDSNIYSKTWNGAGWTPANFDFVGSGHLVLPTRYKFSVDHVHVTTTRSADTDTDAAVASIGAGNWPIQAITQDIGDIGGFTTPKEAQLNLLNFEPVTVELCEFSTLYYAIVNAGHTDRKVLDTALVKAAESVTDDSKSAISKGIGVGLGAIVGFEIIGSAVFSPVIGSLLGSLLDYLMGKLGDVVFADCDGLVAAETIALSGRDLLTKTQDGPISTTTTHPGTDSNTGCGGNSVYEVTWSIHRA